ncbi:2-dehydropantoate 2-reductase [Paenibacillus sp. oral taxon 786 str. D14]|uniref:ketopantoate reductase family protein n=1 Tax=Paenibacillus sp. oral taxon 786 TaxID=652715 RepID=UPI0001AFDB3B|nr:2-dehydropantoate 2-reductase [Paenibacillus sp. oral taxon 786]EES72471.1 2-dehydropantoate 2-reductase [Paenibacillus sp. oral taxon 786 str. D14]
MKIDIIGAGALGLLFGGKLAASGVPVRFWTRTPEQAAKLNKEGIRVTEADGSTTVVGRQRLEAFPVGKSGREGETAEWMLLTIKQWHIDAGLLSFLSQMAETETKVVCFQNGIGHLELIGKALPGVPLYTAITTEGAKRMDECSVKRAGQGTTQIGANGDGANLESNAESFVKILEKAGFTALLSKDIGREIYRKLLINAVINPLTAIWRLNNGQLLENDERVRLLRQLCDEGLRIYEAYGIPYDDDMFDQIAAVCRSTASNVSSMLKDVQQGMPTEIDHINGKLVEMARRKGIPVPGHEMVWRLVRAL